MNEEELQRIQVGSKQEMQQGIACLGQGDWHAALSHFDRAVMLREALPWQSDPDAAWGLAAAWINRSDALRRLEDPRLVPEAIRSLDRGIQAMGVIPLAEKPIFVERLILAWLNRATARGDAGEGEGALEDFRHAETIFAEWGSTTTSDRRFLHSMLHVNRARVLLDLGRSTEGWSDAHAGVAVLRDLEPGEGLIAQAGIRARSVLARALAALIEQEAAAPSSDETRDWIAEATDITEEALAIVRRTGLAEPTAADLVRYGAKI
ncbi:MAG: hypothetical protein QM755_07400, partial [Luteolibacter sp.]